jgi:hypothetical protein
LLRPQIGDHSQKARRDANMTVEELADAMNMDKANVVHHLMNRVTPRPKKIDQYQQALSKRLGKLTITTY